jgi:cysteine synthase A
MASEISQFVDSVITDPGEPVVVFALEWCEFCWSVRKFFAHVGIPYRTVDLDSVEYQKDSRGRKIRDELARRTSMNTIPQVFVGGEFLGGCTDVFDAWNNGSVQQQLEKSGVNFDANAQVDPYTFLPEWLHPR